jgi:hypothetical protein
MGHAAAHLPQPVQRSSCICAMQVDETRMLPSPVSRMPCIRLQQQPQQWQMKLAS